MTRFDPKRTEDLVAAALERPAEARAEFVKREAGGDTDLESRVLEVLSHHWTGAVDEVPLRVRESFEWLGPYRVVRSIGEGGMGEVFLCEQSSPRMPVAVKVLRAFSDAQGGRRRYEVEAEALARLSHEGIARVREAGTVDSILGPRPYIAMEYVDGVRLDEYARERDLGIERCLELAIEIGRAIVHAHENGVIHRDLKPSNVLVTRAGRVKVIDFGIAKLVDEDASSTRTRAGDVFGSLRYMSPEQIRGESQALDRRLDVYALGFIAYELVAGRPPVDVDGKDLAEITRAILEQPVRPLPPRVGKERRTDLDIVLQKALAKDRADRYASAAEFVADLERVLRFEPIRARRPSALREIRLFARRNRALATSVGALTMVLVLGVVATSWQWAAVRAQAKRATSTRDFLREALIDSILPQNARGREVDVMREVAQRIDSTAGLSEVDRAYLWRATGEGFIYLGRPSEAIDVLKRSADLYARELGADSVDALLAQEMRAIAITNAGEIAEGTRLLADIAPRIRHRLGDEHPETHVALHNLASGHVMMGDLHLAEQLLREVYELRNRYDREHVREFLQTIGTIGLVVSCDPDRRTEARPWLERAYFGFVDEFGEDDPGALTTLNNLIGLEFEDGNVATAVDLWHHELAASLRVLPEDHGDVLTSMSNLGYALVQVGEFEAGESMLREALTRGQRSLGAAHPKALEALSNLSIAVVRQGRFDEAAWMGERLVELSSDSLGSVSEPRLKRTVDLGVAYMGAGDFDAAERAYRCALADCEAFGVSRSRWACELRVDLSKCLRRRLEFEEAEQLLLTAVGELAEIAGDDSDPTPDALRQLVWLYEDSERPERAGPYRARLSAHGFNADRHR